jgi:type I restriction enzyme M protein
MAHPRDLLSQIWEIFRRNGVSDELAILEHVAAVLVELRNIRPPSPSAPWPQRYGRSELDASTSMEIGRLVGAAVELAEGDAARVLDPLALFRPTRSRTGGEYPTPRHIVRLMHRLAEVGSHDLLDLACGSGGFLAHRAGGVRDTGASLGVEISGPWARIAAGNTALHLGPKTTNVLQQNALTAVSDISYVPERQRFDRVLMNPPFGGKLERQLVAGMEFLDPAERGSRSETVFARMALHTLAEGGRAGVLLPSGPLFATTSPEAALRRRLLNPEHHLRAVVSFPSDAFQPFSGIQTHLVLVDRAPRQENAPTWFFRLARDGYPGGQGRDLTADPTELSDFPLLEAALHAGEGATELNVPAPLARVAMVPDHPGASPAEHGIVLQAVPDAVVERVVLEPSPLRDSAVPGLVLQVTLSFKDGVHTFVIRSGGNNVEPAPNVPAADVDDEEGEEDGEAPPPALYDRRTDPVQAGRGLGLAVTSAGMLLGRTVLAEALSGTPDLLPERYLTFARRTEAEVSSADLLRDIRQAHAESGRLLEALQGPEAVLPRAASRPEPYPDADAALAVFGEFSDAQDRVYRAVLKQSRSSPGQAETSPVVAPFTLDDVVQTFLELQDPEDTPDSAAPGAFVRETLTILEALGIVVRAHLPASTQSGTALPYYRVATPWDEPVPVDVPAAGDA